MKNVIMWRHNNMLLDNILLTDMLYDNIMLSADNMMFTGIFWYPYRPIWKKMLPLLKG
jgi:hypothetical protein